MAKVLRLHKESNDNITDWELSKRYGKDVINQITDPTGADAKKEITSIPSPFARYDLAKNAFKNVVDSNNLEGKTIHHKMVSDCLDIAELFFNYDKFSEKLEIIVWDKDKELNALKNSNNEEHRILGATLEMYLDQDATTYNFNDFDRIYMLNYKGPGRPAKMNILGGTSPATLFVCSANNLTYASRPLKSNGIDLPFDDEYAPLYKREFAFQKYLYALKLNFGEINFANTFPEFNNYLVENYRHLKDDEKKKIDELKKDSILQYDELSVDGNTVEVLGLRLRKNTAFEGEEMISDFIIKSDKYKSTLPLVLPIQKGNDYVTLRYVQDNWSKDYEAPFFDNVSLNERILPQTALKYPYLTIGDFLQPTIVSMPYELTSSFFDGNVNEKNKTFLLPLTKKFFEFFSVEDLQREVGTNKKMIEIISLLGGSAEVILRIPVQRNRYIEYRRKYLSENEPDIYNNKGAVVEKKFGLGVLPLIKLNNITDKPYYRIAFFSKVNEAKLSFYNDAKPCNEKAIHVVRREYQVIASNRKLSSIESYVLDESFDCIEVNFGGISNMIIPKFIKVGGATQFTFAVDFGTTNTHVEYSTDDNKSSRPLDIRKEEKQMIRMHKIYEPDKDIQYAFDDAFIPDTIGENDIYSFPVRTALAENININYNSPTYSLADANIPFRYEKAAPPRYCSTIKTDIKWSNEVRERVTLYLDNIFFILRNKVLLNNGNLADTKIVWFYPLSMTKFRLNEFKEVWKKLYIKYFGNRTENLIMLSESVAPYYYYKNKKGLKSNAVTIDVGGGTTDVFVVEDNKPKIITSFRFASNSIFGDGYNFSVETNGFVNDFKEPLKNKLIFNQSTSPGISDILNAFDSIAKSENSADIIAFFFSLSSNKVIKENNIPINFLQMLSDNERYKYVFIIFYGALLYHVARMMKAKGLELPQTLAFSGNGSRSLSVLSTDNDTIAQFATLIFEKVYEKKYEKIKLDVILDRDPKLATCKGGIASRKEDLGFDDIENLKTSLLGTDDSTFCDNVTYKDLSEISLQAVTNNVTDFVEFMFDLNSSNKGFFTKSFNADMRLLNKAKDICEHDLLEYTKQGLGKKLEELNAWGIGVDSEIEETLFFYPLVPILNQLGSKLKIE